MPAEQDRIRTLLARAGIEPDIDDLALIARFVAAMPPPRSPRWTTEPMLNQAVREWPHQ